ncbi:hypothetical protein [Nocardiopsis lucentensis]|uniref:hypothetical protein n=1 Tax=Nocardiopsis lucentensis TaxID=53441 RepID=UPI0004783913|nr:hypothetical protein [Nocardiopsis lucentensis]
MTYYWTAATGSAVLFWAIIVPWMPTKRSRWRMAALPLVGVIAAGSVYLETASARVALASYVLLLAGVVINVRPFHRWLPRTIMTDEREGRDPSHARLRDLPLAFTLWSFLVWTATATLIVAFMIMDSRSSW